MFSCLGFSILLIASRASSIHKGPHGTGVATQSHFYRACRQITRLPHAGVQRRALSVSFGRFLVRALLGVDECFKTKRIKFVGIFFPKRKVPSAVSTTSPPSHLPPSTPSFACHVEPELPPRAAAVGSCATFDAVGFWYGRSSYPSLGRRCVCGWRVLLSTR